MTKAYLQIALYVKNENAAAGAGVYAKYKESFLKTVAGAKSKELLVRGGARTCRRFTALTAWSAQTRI